MIRLVLGALVWALLFASPAEAVPVAAVAAILQVSTAVAAVATFAINTVITIGLNWAVNKVFGPKQAKGASAQSQERQASVLQLSIGENPREVIFGRAATGGSLVDAFNHGGQYGTDWETMIIAVADHLCDALEGYWVNDTYYEWSAPGLQEGFNNRLSIWWRQGLADEAMPDVLTSNGWDDANRLHGVAAIIVEYEVDPPDDENPVWSGSRPSFRFLIRGKRCFDPRDAAQSWENPATWVWSENASVCRYNYQRGIYALDQIDDPASLLIGRGLSEFEAPPEGMIAHANLCDEDVDGEPRYRVGGVIRSMDAFIDVEQMFADATAGQIIQPSGGVEVEPGAAKSPVAYLTDDDLVAGEVRTFSDFRSDAQRVNTVIPQYIEPSQGYQSHSADVCRDLADVAADGGPRELTLNLVLVTSRTQANRIGEIRRRENRLERTAALVLNPNWAAIEEGDWVVYTGARTGGEAVTFRVNSFALDAGWRNAVALDETHATVYGGAFVGTLAPVPTTGFPPDALALSGVSIGPVNVEGGEGEIVPGIRGMWTTPVDAAIQTVRIEVRKSTETQADRSVSTNNVNAGQLITTNGIAPNALYYARLVPLGPIGRPIAPSPWVAVSTGGMTVSDVLAIAGRRVAEVIEQLNQIDPLTFAADQLSENLIDTIMRHEALKAFAEAMTYLDGVAIGTVIVNETNQRIEGDTAIVETVALIGAKSGDGSGFIIDYDTLMVSPTESFGQRQTAIDTALADASAALFTEQTARVTADTALADSITALTATVGDVSASVATEATARADADSALSSLISTVSTTVDGHTASITTLVESTDGLSARVALKADVGGRVTGLELSAGASETDFVIVVDKFYIGSPDGNALPFYYDAGLSRLYLNSIYATEGIFDDLTLGGKKLSANAATYPAYAVGSTTYGSGIGTSLLVSSVTVVLDEDALVLADVSFNMGFPSGNQDWAWQLYIDGDQVNGGGGTTYTANVAATGGKSCTVGSISVELYWEAHSSVSCEVPSIKAVGHKK